MNARPINTPARKPSRRSAAPVVATAVLAVCAVESWRLFHRDLICWGRGPGEVLAELGTLLLAGLGLLGVSMSWLAAWWSDSRAAMVTSWALVLLTALCGPGMVLLAAPTCG
ncbi:hypothetical protein ACIRYZ_19230 [Kitasatospora sp. NPDC101155]|uniref:hypothetical protein n=1 Tax=Kitasatospora sp. NPDC101155 TaxID=3364097 RepID=UPI003814C7DA